MTDPQKESGGYAMDIQGKTAVITGGASGLGEATARRLHDLGAHVVIMDLNQERGEAICHELGARAAFALADVRETAQVQAAIRLAMQRSSAIHLAINCAGHGGSMKLVGKDGPYDLDHFQNIVKVNLVGSFDVIRWAALYMGQNEPDAEGERGVIVNTASIAAFDGQIGQAAYAAAKAGLVGMTLPIARELARSGIRVCTIAPGIFETPPLVALPEKVRSSLLAQLPFPPRLGKPPEFAMLVQQIVENPMFNGETIRLDGGLRMPLR
jgi:NAD(P)-dependent dehydrogenase (short-subunit alcohol dehydrogenase family)